MEALLVLFGALLADNLLLSRLFGIESFFTTSEKASKAAAYGATVTAVTVLSGALSLAVYELVLAKLHITFMATFVSVLIICAVVCGINLLSRTVSAKFHSFYTGNLPMITTNCVVLGSIMICIENGISYAVSMLYLLGAGVGFTFALFVFSSVRERLDLSDPPRSFRGLPILLLSACFAAMAFSGFFGLSF